MYFQNKWWVCLCLVLVTCPSLITALDNGLALTPPMGWLSWERFRCNIDCEHDPDNCISEKLYKTMADLMVSEGYKDAGYEYVNIDDCWSEKQRDDNGQLVPDKKRFPSGIKALAKYIHSKGLKLGIYEDFGHFTCAGYPGSEFYMETDARTFAEWDVDSLKFDGCNSDPKDMPYGYPIMGRFLNMTGKQILFNCQWPGYMEAKGLDPNYTDVRSHCNQWRNYRDVQDSWSSVLDIINHYGDNKRDFAKEAGPGGWNDPDMLVVGDFGLSYYQQKAQFGMWAMFAAPMMMSLDLRTAPTSAKSLLLNKNILAINQDKLGNQAFRLFEVPNSVSVWIKKLIFPGEGSMAVAVLNKDDQGVPTKYKTSFSDLGLTHTAGYNVTEAFENKYVGSYKLDQEFTISVDPTCVYIMIINPL